jgi:hypothetical protein
MTAARGEMAAPRPAANAAQAIDMLSRAPRPRPEAGSGSALALLEPGRAEPAEEAPMAPDVPGQAAGAPPPGDEAACLARLQRLGVRFTRLAPLAPGGACAVEAPLDVTALGSGVSITPQAILNCRTAEALATWVRDSLVPAARAELDAEPNTIVHDSTYVCRPRNNQKGARLSEHATGNAVDIKGIAFADRNPVSIGAANGAEGRFQDTIREGSCRIFTTVLGPGSNAAHATHFHFDMAQRRGGYRLCDLGSARTAKRAP